MKRRKAFILILLLVMVGIGVSAFFLFLGTDKSIQDTTSQTAASKQEDPSDKDNTNKAKQDDMENPEDQEVSKDVTAIIEDAVKNTIDYFANRETHLVAIGDSLTQGVGDATGDGGYVGILDKTINKNSQLVEFENYGKRGNRSDQLLKRLDKPEIAKSIKQADIVTITIGANDIMKIVKENITNLSYHDFAKERGDYQKRLTSILDKINDLNTDASIYLLGFYNPFDKYFPEIKELNEIVNDWNTIGESVSKEYENVTFIPTIDLFDDSDVDLFSEDNFHPNTRGYKLIAKRILKYLTAETSA